MKKNMFSKVALAALAAAGGAAATTGVALAQSAPTIQPMSGAPEIRDGQQRFKIRGRFQYDVYSNSWEAPGQSVDAEDGTRSYTRRAFLGAQGRLTDNWRYKIDFVLSPGGAEAGTVTSTTLRLCQDNATMAIVQRAACLVGETDRGPIVTTASGGGAGADDVGVDDAYFEYAGDFFSFVIGENNVTSPLEDRTSSLDIPFLERSSIINAYGYGRAAGAALLISGANWMGAVGVYGDSLNNQDSNFALNEQTAVSGRFTWAPIFETSPEGVTLLHLGAHARQRYSGDDTSGAAFRYRARPFNGRGSRWVEGSSASSAEGDTAYGFEIAGQWNALGFTGEYITIEGETPGGATIESDGYYFDVTWSLTGEARSYRANQGSFGPVVPRQSVGEGGWGHWGLIARYDFIDLSDTDLGGSRGEQTATAVGLNWVPVDHVRFMLNYASTEADRATGVDADADVISLRTQFDF
jgi:phosphate-selective porin OprO/OprP